MGMDCCATVLDQHLESNGCPEGSVAQYRGHLSAGSYLEKSNSEYLCLDESHEDRAGSQDDRDSGYIEHVRSHCGFLPCPPYQESKVVTCVVCSVEGDPRLTTGPTNTYEAASGQLVGLTPREHYKGVQRGQWRSTVAT